MLDRAIRSTARRKPIIWIVGIGLVLLYCVYLLSSHIQRNNAIDCFNYVLDEKNSHTLLQDISIAEHNKPTLGKSIFFLETSCNPGGFIHLTTRQACTIEATVRLHPDRDVYLLFAAPMEQLYYEYSEPLRVLLKYENFFIRNLNIKRFVKDTLAEDWYKTLKLYSSTYIYSHLSDFLRYLTLYKYGGTYLDLDMILTKSLDSLGSNFVGAESEEAVAAGIINFSHDGLGEKMADACLRDFVTNFKGDHWGNNGPGVITRVLKQHCNTKFIKEMYNNPEICNGFQVLPPKSFYAIDYEHKHFEIFFDPKKEALGEKLVKDSIGVHVWNKLTSNYKIRHNETAFYTTLAKKYCPTVFNASMSDMYF